MLDKAALRALPSVDTLTATAGLADAVLRHGRTRVTAAARLILDNVRRNIRDGGVAPALADLVVDVAAQLAADDASSLRTVFNLTGTVLHTNLGRALLAEEATAAATEAMRAAVALEYDLDSGRRGERDDHLRGLLCEMTGAEDGTVVNNNAAAMLLALNTFGAGRAALVSRGELIEIGGAFRMPDIMARAGVRLIEVGTTNRTHSADYRHALGPDTGLILKVHTSNYRIEGFTAEVDTRDLSALAREAGVPLLHDLGSGTLVDLSRWDLRREPTVRDVLAAGADLVAFSGDKLLGGPQAGFIVGRRHLVAALNKNPLKRALRLDKIRLAAIVATLKLYRNPDTLAERLPTLRSLARRAPEIRAQAERLLPQVAAALGPDVDVSVVNCGSQIGSGALPLDTVPSAGLSLRPSGGTGVETLAARLRALLRPVIGRIHDGALQLDLRCLEDEAGFVASIGAP